MRTKTWLLDMYKKQHLSFTSFFCLSRSDNVVLNLMQRAIEKASDRLLRNILYRVWGSNYYYTKIFYTWLKVIERWTSRFRKRPKKSQTQLPLFRNNSYKKSFRARLLYYLVEGGTSSKRHISSLWAPRAPPTCGRWGASPEDWGWGASPEDWGRWLVNTSTEGKSGFHA